MVLYRIDTKRDGITSPTLPATSWCFPEEEFARNWQAGNERGLIVLVDPTENSISTMKVRTCAGLPVC